MTNTQRRGDAPELRDIIPEPQGGKLWFSYWQSPETMAAHIAAMGDGSRNWYRANFENGRNEFFGTSSMNQALRLCRDGWADGATRVAKLRDKIQAANPTGPKMVKWDIAGAIPNVPRYLAGNPLHMKRLDSARIRRRPVLTLISDMSANSETSHDVITNRAAVVAAIVDAIEDNGFSCQLVTFECSKGNGVTQVVAAIVKEAGAQSDIARMAFGLGHASMFRRLSWACFTEDKHTENLGHGLGTAHALNTKKANEMGVYMLPGPEGRDRQFRNEESAATAGLAFLIESLRAQNCPAFPATDMQAA